MAGTDSPSTPLLRALEEIRADLAGTGLDLQTEPIDYGLRLELRAPDRSLTAQLYHSAKRRRLTLVVPPGQDQDLVDRLQQAARKAGVRASGGAGNEPNPAAPVSGDPVIDQLLTVRLPGLHAAGFFAQEMLPIPYGLKLLLVRGEERASVNVYHSRKKGLNLVVGSKVPPSLAQELRSLLQPGSPTAGSEEERSLQRWIGTDEAGKGDYFGPLVAAAVLIDQSQSRKLAALGVQDSKRLANGTLRPLAQRLRDTLRDQAAVVSVGPVRYNELYREYAKSTKLNGLVAWCHGRAVRDLQERGHSFQAVVVDRFARTELITRFMPAGIRLILRPRAEDNLAVAAASILARDAYLDYLERLSRELGETLTSGAGRPVLETGRRLVARHGPEVLRRAGKHHFATTAQILG